MRLPIHHLPLVAISLVAVACGAGAPPPTPVSSSAASVVPGPSADAGAPWLRSTTTQAIPPLSRFAVPDTADITQDGRYITVGPVDAMYPGPLLPNLRQQTLTDAGRQRILDDAARLGLLAGPTDFTGGGGRPGAVLAHLDLTVDGRLVALTGDPEAQIQCITTPCDPPPGTPAAFADLWAKVAEPTTWLGDDLGPDGPFVPEAYALLVGPAPVAEEGMARPPMVLPVDLGLATFGVPVADGTYRCGIVDGADAAALRPAFEQADQVTQWIQGPAMSATFGLSVRPIVANEDPCAETFGAG
jgi:hypothetical protein